MNRFLPSQIVRVKELPEILATLDARGSLAGLPFMPEMAKYCGETFQVYQRAHKFCIETGDVGTFSDVVFLKEVRCDGAEHQGCGRACLIFWKDEWLRPENAAAEEVSKTPLVSLDAIKGMAIAGDTFYCQSTQLMHVSQILPWWNIQQYFDDLTVARVNLFTLIQSLLLLVNNKIDQIRNSPSIGAIPGFSKDKPESKSIGLVSGDLVRVKSLDQIRSTLDHRGKHRGLIFTKEMAAFCGKTFKVRHRVEKFILEHSPKMKPMKATVVLEQVACNGICRRMCVRNSLYFWREIWLEKIDSLGNSQTS